MQLQRTYFFYPTGSIEEFEAFARKAKEFGASHIYVSDLPKSIWQWNLDRKDPYPNWGMESSAIFKVVVPEQLKEFLPVDYAAGNMEILKRRGAVLEQLGLKAAFHACEPGWLPEAVYRAYPHWRGVRCDHPRRATKAYFSPCIDQPEVLEVYRSAIEALCRNVPIEHFNFKTNDAGGGLCWSQASYAGMNGPEHCKHRTMAQRVTGFLDAVQNGAARAGMTASAAFTMGFKEEEIQALLPNLKERQFIVGKDVHGKKIESNIGFFNNYYSSCTYPVIGIPQLMRFLEELEGAYEQQTPLKRISILPTESEECFEILRQFEKEPTHGIVDRYTLLNRVAGKWVGEDLAHLLVDCWDHIYRGVETMRPIDNGGNVVLLGCVSQRWINRPFVAFPMELKPEEKDYYREFQFQANSEEEAADLMNLQGQEHINGYSGTWLATKLMEKSVGNYRKAMEIIEELLGKVPDVPYAQSLRAVHTGIQALICFVKNAIHAACFQEILDRTDYSAVPQDSTRVWTDQGDPRLKELQNIIRAEMDNALELARILETSQTPVLHLAKSSEKEDSFTLGPNLAEQLKKKVHIMQDHWLDLNRLYARFNN